MLLILQVMLRRLLSVMVVQHLSRVATIVEVIYIRHVIIGIVLKTKMVVRLHIMVLPLMLEECMMQLWLRLGMKLWKNTSEVE